MMKTSLPLLLAALLLPMASAAEENTPDGRLLHEERCIRCHGDEVYTRPERKIKSFAKLASQVAVCNSQTGAQLFDDEVTAVTQYLNGSFYKFDPNSP